MSLYIDDKKNNTVTTTQYGSHFVMTGVDQPTKTKLMNIDSRFCNSFDTTSTQIANYNITLPGNIDNVKSMRVTNIELPISYYNISQNNGNNTFTMMIGQGSTIYTVTVPDGQYDANGVVDALNNVVPTVSFELMTLPNQFPIVSITNMNTDSNNNLLFNFATGNDIPAFTLGWLLGFRNSCYNLPPTATMYATAPLSLNGPRYIYLVVDTFQNDNPHSFISTTSTSEINPSILGRITLNPIDYPYGSIYNANTVTGKLLSDKRIYTTKVKIKRLNIQLINEIGIPLDIKQMDFSFSLELECV